jgi:broad specificity phosphatase PhoE
MARITLVRHGQAAAGFGEDHDPGLSPLGQQQAAAAADAVVAQLDGPLPILCSPLRRCRETAQALADRWDVTPTVDAAVGEITSPTDDLAGRTAWLRLAMQGTWSALDDERLAWRDAVVARLLQIDTDTVVHSHFIAINAAVGAALGEDRVVCFAPDNCSITTLETDGRTLSVVTLGGQAMTEVR